MSRMKTGAIVALGLATVSTASAQTRPVKATVSPQQLLCDLQRDCDAPVTTATYETGAEQPFSLDPTSGKAVPKKTAVAAVTPPGRPTGAKVAPGAVKPVKHHATGPADLQITFLVGTADMTPVGIANADVLAKVLGSPKLTGMRIRIEGHTDAQGARDMNMSLSQKRAEAIVDYLVAHGIPRDRLEAQGFGFDKPLPGLAKTAPANRRAVAVVVTN